MELDEWKNLKQERDKWIYYLVIVGILGLIGILANIQDVSKINIYSGITIAIIAYVVFHSLLSLPSLQVYKMDEKST